MQDKRTVEVVCDSCGLRCPVEMHSKLAEVIHSDSAEDRPTEILCSKCAEVMAKEYRERWSLWLK